MMTIDSYCQSKIKLLNVMQNQIMQHQGKLLFTSLINDMKSFSDKEIEQQENLMACLESWWDYNQLAASYLMGRLLPQAAKLIDNHSLCDAIELYLTSENNTIIRQAISILLSEDIRPAYKNKYRKFI